MSTGRRRRAVLGRLGALLLAAGCLHGIGGRMRPQAERALGLAEVRALLPGAQAMSAEGAGWRVTGADGSELGRVLTSLPGSQQVRGYVGPADVLVAVDPGGVVQGARLRFSADTPGHVADVESDGRFWWTFQGRAAAEVRALGSRLTAAWRDAGFDAVSGATRTSDCVQRSVAHALGGAEPKVTLDWRDGLLLVVAAGLGAAACGRMRAGRQAWILRLCGFAALGVVLGDLLSLSLFAGWTAAGVPWRTSLGMVALVGIAFAAPLVAGRNSYCTHVCPLGSLQALVGPGRRARRALRVPRWLGLVLLCVPLALVLVAVAAGTAGLDLDLAALEAFDGFGLGRASLVSLVLLVGGLLLSGFVPMAYCRFGCGTGKLLAWVQRGGGLGVGVLASAGLALGLLLPSAARAQRQVELERLLETLAGGLLEARAGTGSFPPFSPSSAAELVPGLLEGGYLAVAPTNPVTGEPYGTDPFEVDRVWYSLEAGGAACVLEVVSVSGQRVVLSRRVP